MDEAPRVHHTSRAGSGGFNAARGARTAGGGKMPVVGFLDGGSPRERTQQVAAFRKGLAEGGYREGQNVALEFRLGGGSGIAVRIRRARC